MSEVASSVPVTLELTAEEAAALMRLADKISFEDAARTLYAHKPKEFRDEQCYTMMAALTRVHRALDRQGVSAWPWVETGSVE